MAQQKKTAAERFWEKVYPEPNTGCWLWGGSTNGFGYGILRGNNQKLVYAHRWAYEHFVGRVPAGLDVDHLCRVRCCVNPAHLEPVTHRENLLRGKTNAAANAAKTHCINGHPLSGPNLMVRSNGWRVCRYCNRTTVAERRQAARTAKPYEPIREAVPPAIAAGSPISADPRP